LRKTVSFEEQIMSKDKYPSIFSRQIKAIVYLWYSQTEAIVFIIHRFKIGEYPWIFASFSWGIFAHMTRLDQSRTSENIWWIIIGIKQWVIFQEFWNVKRQYLSKYPAEIMLLFLYATRSILQEKLWFLVLIKCFKFGRNSVSLSQPNFRISQLVVWILYNCF